MAIAFNVLIAEPQVDIEGSPQPPPGASEGRYGSAFAPAYFSRAPPWQSGVLRKE